MIWDEVEGCGAVSVLAAREAVSAASSSGGGSGGGMISSANGVEKRDLFFCFRPKRRFLCEFRRKRGAMPPKALASRARAAAAQQAAREAQEAALAASLPPPAETLPLQPMELDDTDTTAEVEHDIEMLDVKPVLPDEDEESPPPAVDLRGKGKGRHVDQTEEMRGLQNVASIGNGLAGGMEGMDEQTFKGKGLTDSIKNVQVSPYALLLAPIVATPLYSC